MEDSKSGTKKKAPPRIKKKTNNEKGERKAHVSSTKSVDLVKKKSKKSSVKKDASSKVTVGAKTSTSQKKKTPRKKEVQAVLAEKETSKDDSNVERHTLKNKSASQVNKNTLSVLDMKENVEPGKKVLTEPIRHSYEQTSSREVADNVPTGSLYSEKTLFLKEDHKSAVDNIVLCLKSEAPFCFIKSEKESYLDYYKEIVIDVFKREREIKLLYFDPKFGDDLSSIINKELEELDIGLIGSSHLDESRKILIIDNEDFSNRLDWELIDSLRLELKSANIGVFSISPNFLDDELKFKTSSIISKFNVFNFSKLKKSELKELREHIAERPEKETLLDIVEALLADSPGKASEGADSSNNNRGVWRKARDYIFRK